MTEEKFKKKAIAEILEYINKNVRNDTEHINLTEDDIYVVQVCSDEYFKHFLLVYYKDMYYEACWNRVCGNGSINMYRRVRTLKLK